MANLIYRGRIENCPRSLNKVLAAALLCGTFVEVNASDQFAQITSADDTRPLILTNMEFKDQTINDAYVSGDTGVAFELNPNDMFYARLGAATYTSGQPLTIGASGRLVAAAAGDRVIAHFDDTPGAFTAGQFADVVIANSYVKA